MSDEILNPAYVAAEALELFRKRWLPQLDDEPSGPWQRAVEDVITDIDTIYDGSYLVTPPFCCVVEGVAEWVHAEGCPANNDIEPPDENAGLLHSVRALPSDAQERIQQMTEVFKTMYHPLVKAHPDFGPLLQVITEAVLKAHIRAEWTETNLADVQGWLPDVGARDLSGSVLPDHAISKQQFERQGYPLISPFDQDRVQPASYDLSLANGFLIFKGSTEVIDPYEAIGLMERVDVEEGRSFVLHPGSFALGSTVERLMFPDDLCGQLGGKSSLGRLGLQVHATAGFFDPGYQGNPTLELSNVSPFPIRLHPGMKIAQMVFMRLEAKADRPYGHPGLGSKYTGSRAAGVVESFYHENETQEQYEQRRLQDPWS